MRQLCSLESFTDYGLFLFPTYLQCHSTRTKSLPFKHTVLTFITDNAGPPRWANTATVFTVTSASIQTILTAQATVIAKSVIKANWNEIYRRLSEHPDKIIPQALTYCSRCTSARRNLHNIDSLKKSIHVVSVNVGSVAIPLIHRKRQSQMEIPKFSSSNFRL